MAVVFLARLGVLVLELGKKSNSSGEGWSLSTFRNGGYNQQASVQIRTGLPMIQTGAFLSVNS